MKQIKKIYFGFIMLVLFQGNAAMAINACMPNFPGASEYTECNGAKTASGKLAMVQLHRSGTSSCYELKIYASGGGIGVGNTCGGLGGSWALRSPDGRNGFAEGVGRAIVWLLRNM